MMRRWLPHPAMTALLVATWLLLNQSLAPGQILLGAAIGVVLGKTFERLGPPRARIRKPHLIPVLAARVLHDIVRSNLAVMRIVLSGRARHIHSGFVRVPLLLTSPYGLALLACIITSTPGTVWVSYEPEEGILLIHVFDLVDESTWIDTITRRYEAPLRDIFE